MRNSCSVAAGIPTESIARAFYATYHSALDNGLARPLRIDRLAKVEPLLDIELARERIGVENHEVAPVDIDAYANLEVIPRPVVTVRPSVLGVVALGRRPPRVRFRDLPSPKQLGHRVAAVVGLVDLEHLWMGTRVWVGGGAS